MRRAAGRLLVALAIAFPVPVLVMTAANGLSAGATGPAVMKCMHWKDDLHISPGVGNVPSAQTVTGHGRLYGCNKAGGGGQFSGNFHMVGATCDNLSMSGAATFEWVDGGHSTAFLMLHPQALEPNKVFVNGTVTSGNFDGLVVSAWVRFTRVFTGSGAPCSPTNLLRKISFTNSQSFQLLTPQIVTTTTSSGTTPSTTPTTRPHTTTSGPPTTVPVTNQGSTTTGGHAPPPVTFVIQQSGGGGGGPGPVGSSPQGTLAFTGSSGLAALFGLEALLIGGALACLDPARKERRVLRLAARGGAAKAWLRVTLPPSPMR